MNKLNVTKEWVKWFHKEAIEVVGTIDNREMFTQTFEGNFIGDQLNYKTVFKLIDAFVSSYDFLELDYIRLVWSKELENKNLQFYRSENDFLVWKKNVIDDNFEIENSYLGDYEDPSEIFYNYCLNADGEEISLYKYSSNDRTAIYLWYNLKTKTTHYSINIEFRRSLFMIDKRFETNLSSNCIEFNNRLLANAKIKLLEKLKK
jgi:hypothetical protein